MVCPCRTFRSPNQGPWLYIFPVQSLDISLPCRLLAAPLSQRLQLLDVSPGAVERSSGLLQLLTIERGHLDAHLLDELLRAPGQAISGTRLEFLPIETQPGREVVAILRVPSSRVLRLKHALA